MWICFFFFTLIGNQYFLDTYCLLPFFHIQTKFLLLLNVKNITYYNYNMQVSLWCLMPLSTIFQLYRYNMYKQYKNNKQSFKCVSNINFVSDFTIFRLNLGTVLMVWYFYFLHFVMFSVLRYKWNRIIRDSSLRESSRFIMAFYMTHFIAVKFVK